MPITNINIDRNSSVEQHEFEGSQGLKELKRWLEEMEADEGALTFTATTKIAYPRNMETGLYHHEKQ